MNKPNSRKEVFKDSKEVKSNPQQPFRKPKEAANPKISSSPVIYSNKAPGKKATSNSKVEMPSTPYTPLMNKNAIEMITKLSDEKYREIKDVNLQMTGQEDRRKSLHKNFSENDVISNIRPSTPQYRKPFTGKMNNFVKGDKNLKYNSNANVKVKRKNLSREQAAVKIQRNFRIFLRRRQNDPKYEIANMLKRKKLSILKSYNIIDNKENIEASFNDRDNSKLPAKSKEKSFIPNVSSSVKEEDKQTAKFGKNVFSLVSAEKNENLNTESNNQNDSRLTSLKEEKYLRPNSNFKDNFIDDYESFLSYKKFSDAKGKDISTPRNDQNLNKLKMSLDQYSVNDNTKSVKVGAYNPTDNNEDDFDILDIITNKDQTGITKNDISDTVNVYEKIFKEIRKEKNVRDLSVKDKENFNISTSVKEKINLNTSVKEVKEVREIKVDKSDNAVKTDKVDQSSLGKLDIEELDSKLDYIDKNIDKINQKYISDNLKKDKSSIVNYLESETMTEVNVKTNPMISSYTNKTNEEEKKRMVERLNQMLETEEIKNNIQSSIADSSYRKLDDLDTLMPKDDTKIHNKISKIHSILDNSNINNTTSLLKYDKNVSTAEVLNMQLELKECKNTIDTMKDIIEELKREIKSKEENYKKDIQDKTSLQKFEFDNVMQRQNGLIESLLSEKKKFTSTIDELSEKLEGVDKINHKKMQQLVENFDLELRKNKDAWFQAEKIRRKKWEDTKLKEIKESTVKGLEPEIERILASHKAELTKMEDRMNEELRRQRDRINTENERRLQEVKERFNKEKEEALEHERSLNGQRIRNQNERLEEEYNEERRRWNAHFTSEIERLEGLRDKDKKLYEDQIAKIEDRNLKLLQEKENFYKLKISEMEKRFEDRIKDENDNYKIRFEKEKDKFIEDKIKEFEQKARDLKNDLLKDRDKQIQIIIEKLGEETINERKKIQAECERKADEINKSLKIDNTQMQQKLQELSDKLAAETKVRIMLDDNLDLLSRKLQDKEREATKKEKHLLELNASYNDLNTKYSSIMKDFNREKLDIELEYKSKLQKAESDFKLLNEKLDSVKAYYEAKINDVQTLHKNEIYDIEEKIKKALTKKDDIIKKIQEDLQFKDITIQKYEEMLAKQRKELLMMNNK